MTTTLSPQASDPASLGRRSGLVAIVVALVAVVLALASSAIAWHASTKVDDATDRLEALEKSRIITPASPVGPAPSPADQPVSGETTVAPPGPTDDASPSVPVLDAQTQYAVRYTDKPLTIAPSRGQYVYIDLDEPRVQADQNVADLRYYDSGGSEPANFRMQAGVDGSKVSSEKTTPAACADQIVSSPLLHDQNFPVHRGDVFCLTTSLDSARARGITWKLVVLAVQATAPDGTVSLKASAWDIPIK